jgi:hypothetical protein
MNGLSDIGIANRMTGSGHLTRAGRDLFPDPWLDYAALEMPKTLDNVLQWSEFVWLTNGTFRMACERVIRYFLTRIEVEDVDDEEAEKYVDFLNNVLKAVELLATLGDDFIAYGNSFSSILPPFDRFLRCPKCYLERPIEKVIYQFSKDFKFNGMCPGCKNQVTYVRKDRRSNNDAEFKVMRWSPHNMIIQYNPLTHDVEYRYRFPDSQKRKIREGDKFMLRTTPWEMVDAIRQDKLFRFDGDRIYHMKEDTLAGVRALGWGIPRLIANFKQAYYVQVLHRYNEALAMDYIVPFRLLTPQPGSSSVADPLLHQNLGVTKGQVLDMVAEHRRDPATWHFLPFPLQYQSLGGEGMQMATHELIAAGNDELLNGMGVPADFYKGTLQLQAAPTALRLFQQTWPQIPANYNGWLTWAIRQVATIKNWEPATARMQPVTLADDLEKKQILLQLAAAKEVSKGTAFGPFGIDVREEQRRIYDEARQQSDLERDFQNEETERAKMEEQLAMVEQGAAGGMPPGGAMPGAMPPGGAMPGAMPPGGAGMGGGSSTPQDMMIQAEQLAQQLLGMPYEVRRSEMQKIKQSDEALHALVKSKMDQMRQSAGNEGKMMMQQQLAQQPPPAM